MTHLLPRGTATARPARRGFFVVLLVLSAGTLTAPTSDAQSGQELFPNRNGTFSYGSGVAISGDVAAVAGFIERNPTFNTDVPTVDVYRYDGAAWVFEQHLFSSDPVFYNDFGSSIRIDGDLIVVGAPHVGKGAALTFRYDGSSWVEEDVVQPLSPTSIDDEFGFVVGVSGSRMIVPDTRDWDGFLERELAYVFEYDGSAWIMDDTLQASDAYSGSGFGISADVHGDMLVVGDPFFSVSATLSREGVAYVFENDAGTWGETQKLDAGGFQVPDARFGQSVATDGTTIIAGAQRDSVGELWQAGAAYVFRRAAGVWAPQQRLTASDAKQQGYFGLVAAVAGDYMIVGAPSDVRPNFVNDGGRAYFFEFNGAEWREETLLGVADPVTDDRFGNAVDTDGTWVIVGAPGRRNGQWRTGAAYIFPVATLVANERVGDVRHADDNVTVTVRPNPVVSEGMISVVLSAPDAIRCEVYDVTGRRVARLFDGHVGPGPLDLPWQADGLAPGVYFVRVTTSSSTVVAAAVLTR